MKGKEGSPAPAPWGNAMRKQGIRSLRQLAEEAGVATTTVSRLVQGIGKTSETTLEHVAEALKVPVTTVRRWAGAPIGEDEHFSWPAHANQLTDRERAVVLSVIDAILARTRIATADRPPIAGGC